MATPDKSRFIQDITIRNFKCFEELKIEGCGQFNLILGDNNVGKTSVLEALLVDEDAHQTLDNLANRRYGRYMPDPFSPPSLANNPFEGLVSFFARTQPDFNLEFGIEINAKSESHSGVIELKEVAARALSAEQRGFLKKIGGNSLTAFQHSSFGETSLIPTDISLQSKYTPFVATKDFYGPELVDFFAQHIAISNALITDLVDALRGFIALIERIEIGVDKVMGNQLVMRLQNQDRALPLASFGDGTLKLCRILLELPQTVNRRLMIDEIDAGIHYSRFATLWRTTLKAAIDNNVQLFITTHNIECLRALNQVLETEEFADYREECRSFTLQKLPDGSTKAYRYNYSQFEYAINAEMELRGRKL